MGLDVSNKRYMSCTLALGEAVLLSLVAGVLVVPGVVAVLRVLRVLRLQVELRVMAVVLCPLQSSQGNHEHLG